LAAGSLARGFSHVVLLSGGVGGARLAAGLAEVLAPEALSVVVNTADDFVMDGLHISPDVDTVVYTLAGADHPIQGWGLQDESDRVQRALIDRGDAPWFFLGDRDLATHRLRTRWLSEGATPTAVTARLTASWGVRSEVLPMSDAPVATRVLTDSGELAFQDWFVRLRSEPEPLGLRFEGARDARATPEVARALERAEAVIVGPSNPYLSIGPILAIDGILERLCRPSVPTVAVSPIVGGRALKGPADRMLTRFHGEASPLAVAEIYRTFLTGMVIDDRDRDMASRLQATGIAARHTDIVMSGPEGRRRVALAALDLASTLR
jgi:LPPG:FO 2-phospho-L-lactate transferase